MIRFQLACSSEHEFEGWFRGNDAYEAQVAAGSLACPVCGSREIKKAIMAPAITRSTAPEPMTTERRAAVQGRLLEMMRSVREHVETNFENVGERFPDEARAMHQGIVEARGIYGAASREAVAELLDEGVPIQPLPMIPKLDG